MPSWSFLKICLYAGKVKGEPVAQHHMLPLIPRVKVCHVGVENIRRVWHSYYSARVDLSTTALGADAVVSTGILGSSLVFAVSKPGQINNRKERKAG